MNEQKIKDLKNALMEVVKMIIARGGPLSPEMKLLLAQAIAHVADRILELRREEQGSVEGLQPAAQPELKQAMPSSNIFGYNYDYDNGKLLVKFQGDDGVGQGPVYSYDGVPKYMFDLFRRGAAIAKTTGSNKWGKWWKGKSPSIGAAMHAFIKNGGYPYQKLG